MANKEEKEALTLSLSLEPPPASETPVQGVGQLFAADDDAIADLTARFTIADSCLRLLTRDLVFKDFVREMLFSAMKVIKAEAGSILELDHANNRLFFRAAVGKSSAAITTFTIPMGQGIVGHVAESKQPLVVDDIEDNQLHLKAIAKAVGFETRNLVAVPIIIRGKTYGVLELLNRVGEKNFTRRDLDLLNYFCEIASKAIEIRFMIAWARQANTSNDNKGSAA